MVDNPAFLTQDALFDNFSEPFIDMVNKLMDQNPNTRLGFFGAGEIKAHPFFKGYDWAKVVTKSIKPPYTPKVLHYNSDIFFAF